MRIIILILLIGMVSATTIYPGDTKIIIENMPEYIYYTIEANTSSVEGIIINQTDNDVYLTLPKDFPPNDFNILFYTNLSERVEEIYHYEYSGGGTKYVNQTKTIYINNTEYIDVVNNSLSDELDNLKSKKNIFMWLFFVCICVILGLIVYLNKERFFSGEEDCPSRYY